MINKNSLIIYVLSLTTGLVPITANADITALAIMNYESRTVEISGKLDEFTSSTDITLTSVKRLDNKGLETNKIYNLSDEQKSSLYVKQVPVSADGVFSFTFTPSGKSGKYDYYIN